MRVDKKTTMYRQLCSHSDGSDWQQESVDRRVFLKRMAAFSLLLSSSSLIASVADKKLSREQPINDEPWLTLAAVQVQLFPTTDDGPGAREIHATDYLRTVLESSDIDAEEKDFILKGVGWLNGIAEDQYGGLFLTLTIEQRELVLRSIARSRAGENWLAVMLTYIFEALLSDPVYGGNPNAIGWQWLEHQPGFPRPAENKRYDQL